MLHPLGTGTHWIFVLGWCCWVWGELAVIDPDSTEDPDYQAPHIDKIQSGSGAGISDELGAGSCPIHCSCEIRTSPLSGSLKRTMDCRAGGLIHTPPFINASLDTEALLLATNHLHPDQVVNLDRMSNLTELDLSANSIYSLEYLRLDVDSLLYYLLDHNKIDYLSNRAFISTPNLIFLSLIGNRIELMHAEAFVGLHNLQTLDLTGNRIFDLDVEWFRPLTSLHVLHLHDNNIHVVQPNAFKFMHSLKTLDLSQNHIKHVYDTAFFGLSGLHQLDLQNNHLDTVPLKALSEFKSLRVLDLSGNHFEILDHGSVTGINVSMLLLNNIQQLHILDKGAITNMQFLTHLELTNNPHLMYVNNDALTGLPNLATLKLHQNNVSVLEENLVKGLPSLKQLSIYGNNLHCDCTLNWLIRELTLHGRNISIVSPDADDGAEDEGDKAPPPPFVCASPPSLKDATPTDSRLHNLPPTCSPRILDLFPADYHTALGESVSMDCRATGIPLPQTDWLLPADPNARNPGEVVLVRAGGTSPRPHVQVTRDGTLEVDYVQASDQGKYTCLASNPNGRDERSAFINVTNIQANVIIMRITSNAITVTWKSSRYAHDYQILYREYGENNITYQVIDIKPYMRSYTISELEAQTKYEFCIAVQHATRSVRINCTHVSTRETDFLARSIFDSRDYIIGGSISAFLCLGILVCVLTHVVRRYNKRRRQQEELYTDNLSQLFLASMDSMSDTTPITYENRAAEMFDDDDIDEIRSTASMASTSASSIR